MSLALTHGPERRGRRGRAGPACPRLAPVRSEAARRAAQGKGSRRHLLLPRGLFALDGLLQGLLGRGRRGRITRRGRSFWRFCCFGFLVWKRCQGTSPGVFELLFLGLHGAPHCVPTVSFLCRQSVGKGRGLVSTLRLPISRPSAALSGRFSDDRGSWVCQAQGPPPLNPGVCQRLPGKHVAFLSDPDTGQSFCSA